MKIKFYTLGCKVNQYETEAMREKFAAAGYQVSEGAAEEDTAREGAAEEGADQGNTDREPAADIYVINTCTVTNLADRKSRQIIRRAKKANPEALIAVTGCYAQVSPEEVAEIEGVDLIAGTNEKQRIVEYIEEALAARTEEASIHIKDYADLDDYCSDGIITAMESRTRAYIKIQEGCNRFCSYCIIPFARGKVRSREEAEIVEEARGLVEAGFKEIVLTGINTALYGADAEAAETSFGLRNLLKKLDDLPGDFRVRLSSLEPTVVSPEYVKSILDSKRLCPHLHLSIQSGSDNILKAMNRRYTRSEYLGIVEMLRAKNPRFGITTDIIVGFPGETEEDFRDTLDLVENAGFSKVHVFRYSPRKGTKAAEMSNQIRGNVKSLRGGILTEAAERASLRFMETQVGSIGRMLVEEAVLISGVGKFLVGYTENYTRVYVEAPTEQLINTFSDVKLMEPFQDGMLGEIIAR